jgi:hypothetical protein
MTEAACPFCGAFELETLSGSVSRVARSAVIAGAIVVATGVVVACSAVTPEPAYGCAPPCGEVDAGGDAPLDG